MVAGCLYAAPYYKITKIDPVAKALLAYIPLPNIPNYTIGGNNYEFNGNKISNDTNSLLKITHKLTASDDLEGLFDRHFSKSSNPTGGSPLGFFGPDSANGILGGNFGTAGQVHDTLIAFGETHIFSPNVVNNFHYGRTRSVSDTTANDAGVNFAQSLGIQGTTTGPSTLLNFPSFKPSGVASIATTLRTPLASS